MRASQGPDGRSSAEVDWTALDAFLPGPESVRLVLTTVIDVRTREILSCRIGFFPPEPTA